MNLLLLERGEVSDDGIAWLTAARAASIPDLAKASPGLTLRAGIVDGPLGWAIVESVQADGIRLRCRWDSEAPPRSSISVLLAMPRPKAMNRLWCALAMAGVDRIVVVGAERVEPSYFRSRVMSSEVIRARMLEGLAQAVDTRLPLVEIHPDVSDFLHAGFEELAGPSIRLLALPGTGMRPAEAVRAGESVWLAVGPETGWSPKELEALQAHGFRPITLGPRVWRSEWACVALIALIHDAMAGSATASRSMSGGQS